VDSAARLPGLPGLGPASRGAPGLPKRTNAPTAPLHPDHLCQPLALPHIPLFLRSTPRLWTMPTRSPRPWLLCLGHLETGRASARLVPPLFAVALSSASRPAPIRHISLSRLRLPLSCSPPTSLVPYALDSASRLRVSIFSAPPRLLVSFFPMLSMSPSSPLRARS